MPEPSTAEAPSAPVVFPPGLRGPLLVVVLLGLAGASAAVEIGAERPGFRAQVAEGRLLHHVWGWMPWLYAAVQVVRLRGFRRGQQVIVAAAALALVASAVIYGQRLFGPFRAGYELTLVLGPLVQAGLIGIAGVLLGMIRRLTVRE